MAAGDTLQGRRVKNLSEATAEDGSFTPGCYWKVEPEDGAPGWWIIDPTGEIGRLGGHSVTESEDGTITVSPSILSTVEDHGHDWHGFLENGVWREV